MICVSKFLVYCESSTAANIGNKESDKDGDDDNDECADHGSLHAKAAVDSPSLEASRTPVLSISTGSSPAMKPRRVTSSHHDGAAKDAFALLRANSSNQFQAGSKRPTTTRPAASLAVKAPPLEKKRRELTPEQRALLEAVPEGKKRRNYFNQEQKSKGERASLIDCERISCSVSNAAWLFYQSLVTEPGGQPNKKMAADYLSQKVGFERFSRQHLRGWEKSLARDAARADFDKACDDARSSDADSDTPRGPVPKAKKRGRKDFPEFESRVLAKLACELS